MNTEEELKNEVARFFGLVKNYRKYNRETPKFHFLKLAENAYKELKTISHRNNIFFEFCPFEVYKETFPKRFWKFEEVYQDSDINDFIKSEVIRLKKIDFSDLSIFIKTDFEVIKNRIFNWFEEVKTQDTSNSNNLVEFCEEKSKNGLTIAQRYLLLEALLEKSQLQKLTQKGVAKNEVNKFIAFLLDTNIDNAKKLINGNYSPLINMSEEKETRVNQIIETIKPKY